MTPRELALRRTVPVVINSYNQLSYLRELVESLLRHKFRNLYILDNASSYPPLLGYYEKLAASDDATVLYYGVNRGPHYFFTAEIYRQVFGSIPFLYTDPDLALPTVHDNLLSYWLDLSQHYKMFKVGSALTMPQPVQLKNPQLRLQHQGQSYSLLEWEAQFWRTPISPNVYIAPIDTTLHLFNTAHYTPGAPLIDGIRVAGEGFEALHRPWFLDDNCPEDELEHYRRGAKYSNWT